MLPIRAQGNPIAMRKSRRGGQGRRTRRSVLRALSLALLLTLPLRAEAPPKAYDPYAPLPQDTGAAGLKQMLLRLQTTARLMQTTAHPDDEDGGMLTLESRGEGASVLLMTLTRGEGGQNKTGSNLFDVLGVVRTLEQLTSDRYYAVEQRFSRVADFGYSKSADETFQKWHGHDIAFDDMVRVIRTFRPDVLVARFSGTERDGHGHHQASAILTKEAFRAAADPNRFPEQIKEGLQPWQPKKLYIGNVCGFGALTCPPENYTVKLATGVFNPALGMTYVQFAITGLNHELSQGLGNISVDGGPHFAFYKLVDSVLPPTTDKDGHEKDFWDGIDTSLPGLAARLGDEEKDIPWLRTDLAELQKKIGEASAAAQKDSYSAVTPLSEASEINFKLTEKISHAELSSAAKDTLLAVLGNERTNLNAALNLAAGVDFRAVVNAPAGSDPDHAFMAVPGQTFDVTANFSSPHKEIEARRFEIGVIAGGTATGTKSGPGSENFRVTPSPNAQYTRPYWHRDDPEVESINKIDDPRYVTYPFPPPALLAQATVEENRHSPWTAAATCMVKYKDADGNDAERPLAVALAFSIALEPSTEIIPVSDDGTTQIKVGVRGNIITAAEALLQLKLPNGWSAEPKSLPVSFSQTGQLKEFNFRVWPSATKEGRAQIGAVLSYQGSSYDVGYTVVTRPDLPTFYYYQPAIQRVSIVDVRVPSNLKVGYIMGAGDDIPTVLQQIGMSVTLIPAEKLASENLGQFGTIVVGIRAYDTQKDVTANNKKLLDYVANGGTLVVQYNTGVGDFNSGHFTPYPATLARGRVSVEEAPVEILAPDDGVFHYPNQITQKDFDGWVQERGLYFMDQWDNNFKPLLASHDPGEQPLKGGLLKAQYGKGIYIYTGYAFFRQLPAGVPGAIRLYVNLLSAGHEAPVSGR